MESRVMGNCHARFGAGENLEERICSLRLHILPKGLPIAILRNCCRSAREQTTWTVPKIADCRAESPDGAVGGRVFAVVSFCKHSGCNKEGL